MVNQNRCTYVSLQAFSYGFSGAVLNGREVALMFLIMFSCTTGILQLMRAGGHVNARGRAWKENGRQFQVQCVCCSRQV